MAFQKGHKVPEEWRKKMREAHKRKLYGFQKGHKIRLGIKHTEESKKKMSESQKRNPTRYWLGKKHPHTEEVKRKISEALKGNKNSLGKHYSKAARKNMSDARKKQWQNDKYRKRILGHRAMSGLEKRVLKIINKHKLPYRFVGNGDFSLEGKCPDFINTNGEKKAIEVFWNRHKEQFRNGGVNGWKKDRLKIFEKYGWQVIFIEGTKLNEQKVLSALKGGD